jgi:hypothetical protein
MCTDDKFSFLLVVNQQGLKSLASQGLVGLSPKYFEKGADQFTTKLKAAGAIDSTAFSISIAQGDGQSKITFGGYNLTEFATGNATWHSINPTSIYWQL